MDVVVGCLSRFMRWTSELVLTRDNIKSVVMLLLAAMREDQWMAARYRDEIKPIWLSRPPARLTCVGVSPQCQFWRASELAA